MHPVTECYRTCRIYGCSACHTRHTAWHCKVAARTQNITTIIMNSISVVCHVTRPAVPCQQQVTIHMVCIHSSSSRRCTRQLAPQCFLQQVLPLLSLPLLLVPHPICQLLHYAMHSQGCVQQPAPLAMHLEQLRDMQ